MNKRGFLVVQILVFAAVSAIILSALALWGATSFTASRKAVLREQAFHIAEAGIEYYRWHLAHNSTDYTDGTNTASPYVHTYNDKDGNKIGAFALTITPPPNGGSTVVIDSKGTVSEDTSISRTLEETLSIPSYAQYAVIGGSAPLDFGTGVDVTGQVIGNGGVRFDGVAHNIVSSAVDKYNDDSYDNTQVNMLGVHTDVSPADPPAPVSAIPPHSDVFQAGREFPPFYNISAIDFNALTATLSDLKTQSQSSGGFYLPAAPSPYIGYHIVLKTNGTFDVYNVSKTHSDPHCYSYATWQPGWDMGSIDNEVLVSSNNPYPSNGIIFVEDNLWLSGQINHNRLTIAAGSFYANGNGSPQSKNVTINNSLTYSNYDGTDVLGIIAQNNINVGWASDNNLRIDGALVAQGGRIGRYYFLPPSSDYYTCGTNAIRNSIYLYGMLASDGSSGFTYSDGTGYQTRTIVYDSNLYYDPPPSFPKTSSQYSILSWKELQK